MPTYAVLSVLLLPFVGFYMLANDGYAISVGMPGFHNGVEVPYFVFFSCFVASLYLLKRRTISIVECIGNYPVERNYMFAISILVLLINIAILLAFLFIWGGINFFTVDLGRGEYRANLSGGMLYYWLMKIIAPGMFTFFFISYLRGAPKNADKALFYMNIIILMCIGASTGFKSTFINLLLPVLLVYYWNANLIKFFIVSILSALAILLVYYFVTDDSGSLTIVDLFVQRLFIAQSDVSWHIWNLYISNESFPSYAQSLMSVFGSKFVSAITGVDRGNLDQWIYYDYSSLLMVIAGLPVSAIAEGHNIIGTLFSESLIALGIIGIPLFSIGSGFFVAFIFNSIQRNARDGKFIYMSMVTTYFGLFVLPGLWGGGLTTFFHLSTAIGFLVLYIILIIISLIARRVRFVSRYYHPLRTTVSTYQITHV